MKNKSVFFYLIVSALFLGMISPNWLSDGMFMDGVLYATISRNLAENLGSFWDLHLTDTLSPHFHGHPPFAFGLQSLFFRLLGDNLITERLYSFLTFLITAIIIRGIWKQLVGQQHSNMSWLPILLWVSVPVVTWAAPNNMLENTMMVFTSLSVYFAIKSEINNRFLHLFLAGFSLFLAFLTKGFVGLFPISILFWILIFKKTNVLKFFSGLTILFSAILIPIFFMYIFVPEGIDSLKAYINLQVLGSIENSVTVDNRWFILTKLLNELLPIGIIAVVIFISTRKIKVERLPGKWVLIFLALGLSGVLPIMISLKQSGFYILGTFPIFSIAFGLLLAPRLNVLLIRISPNNKILKYSSICLFSISIILNVLNFNRIGRDEGKISDVYAMIEEIPKNTVVSIQPNLRKDWTLHASFGRYANISLDKKTPAVNEYLISNVDSEIILNPDYEKINIKLSLYRLYKKTGDISLEKKTIVSGLVPVESSLTVDGSSEK